MLVDVLSWSCINEMSFASHQSQPLADPPSNSHDSSTSHPTSLQPHHPAISQSNQPSGTVHPAISHTIQERTTAAKYQPLHPNISTANPKPLLPRETLEC